MHQIRDKVASKTQARAGLLRDYASNTFSTEDVERVLDSIADANNYIAFNVAPVERWEYSEIHAYSRPYLVSFYLSGISVFEVLQSGTLIAGQWNSCANVDAASWDELHSSGPYPVFE